MTICNPCRSEMDSVLPDENQEYSKIVHQATVVQDGSSFQGGGKKRIIPYATCGDRSGDPILFFPPLGASRRMILLLQEVLQKNSLWAVCVSRPGAEEGRAAAENAPSQVEAFIQDTLVVMDELKIQKAGIFCMCAGTPFAMAFCAKYPDRTTGRFLALGPWTLPADCPDSQFWDRFAANHLPNLGISSLVGALQSTAMSYFSIEFISKKMRDKSSDAEKKVFEERYQERPEGTFTRELDWVIGKVHNEKMDIAVCLSKSSDLGFDCQDLSSQDILIWQGDKDKITSARATKWLAQQLPHASLHLIPGSTHQGALFMLGTEYLDAVAHLKVQ